jgi:hypothetical protein
MHVWNICFNIRRGNITNLLYQLIIHLSKLKSERFYEVSYLWSTKPDRRSKVIYSWSHYLTRQDHQIRYWQQKIFCSERTEVHLLWTTILWKETWIFPNYSWKRNDHKILIKMSYLQIKCWKKQLIDFILMNKYYKDEPNKEFNIAETNYN